MRIQIFLFVFTLLLPAFQSKPGHMVHDFYKCDSDYYRRNFKHCKELNEVGGYNSRRGRGLEGQYSSAHHTSQSLVLGTASVMLALSRLYSS